MGFFDLPRVNLYAVVGEIAMLTNKLVDTDYLRGFIDLPIPGT